MVWKEVEDRSNEELEGTKPDSVVSSIDLISVDII
jgi:hypothetical protein